MEPWGNLGGTLGEPSGTLWKLLGEPWEHLGKHWGNLGGTLRKHGDPQPRRRSRTPPLPPPRLIYWNPQTKNTGQRAKKAWQLRWKSAKPGKADDSSVGGVAILV